MTTQSLGFNDLRLEFYGFAFRLSTKENNPSIFRLHAFSSSGGRTMVVFHLTEKRRWFSSHVMSAIEAGVMDDGGWVFDKTFHPELRVLRSRLLARESIKCMLLRLGILCPEILEGCGDCIAFFSSAAAGIVATTGCPAVVIVVEISLFRIYDDSEDAGAICFSSSFSSVVDGLEVAEGREGSRCAICLEDFVPGMELARLPCLHVMFAVWVSGWRRHQRVRSAVDVCGRWYSVQKFADASSSIICFVDVSKS